MTPEIPVDSRMPPAYIHPHSMTPESFKAACEAKGITTQMQAASILGVEQSTVSRWMSGARPIPPIVAVALLGVQPRNAQVTASRARSRARKSKTAKQ